MNGTEAASQTQTVEARPELQPTTEDLIGARWRFLDMGRHERQAYLVEHLGQIAEFVSGGVASNDVIREGVALYRVHRELWAEEVKAEQATAEAPTFDPIGEIAGPIEVDLPEVWSEVSA